MDALLRRIAAKKARLDALRPPSAAEEAQRPITRAVIDYLPVPLSSVNAGVGSVFTPLSTP